MTRWEQVLGRPAPAPTEPGPRGGARVSACFVEWMMGLPAGWVTDVPGLSWSQQLKLLGNGVVPQQAAEALRRAGLGGVAAPHAHRAADAGGVGAPAVGVARQGAPQRPPPPGGHSSSSSSSRPAAARSCAVGSWSQVATCASGPR